MSRKCPPGVICIENMTIFILFLLLAIIVFLLYSQKNTKEKVIIKQQTNDAGFFPKPSYTYTNIPDDVLLNPYQAPLRDDRIFSNFNVNSNIGIPINIKTQGYDTSYRQIGILTRISGSEMILPLMGRPLLSNRDKWNFYTMTDKNNMIKLPVSHKGKSCTNEYGCDNIYNGDTVYVEGYNDAFKATIYDNDVVKYIPYL